MDANGTRFHLLLGYDDWSSCPDVDGIALRDVNETLRASSGLAWDHERHELTLRPRLFQFIAAPKDNRPTLDMRRGAARDRYDNWYWIDDTRRVIRVLSSGDGTTSDFWPTPERAACEPPRFGDFQPTETPAAP
ncbi:MAG: hypothetical protein ABI874_13605, partial [Chloroflexota bacterium]